jgi:DNA polymerase-3 subunit gamma/tau
MPYTALYRKKRPKTFDRIVGQPHVVQALTNQIKSGKISHAYLFCGTRGTGKTTAAKIFARAVNCERPIDGEPCNICETCLGILSERNLGVAEIDAASNNGVDNIRELREEIKYPPTEGRYKVYILDEAHMLSTGAVNALLKTLEEPPAHAVFILATTDPQKIPATVLSRCQRYDFRRITDADMVTTMRGYLESDGVNDVTDGALALIASQSDGAMRDALSILDQALSLYAGETIDEGKIYELLGAVDRRILDDFTYALAVSDSQSLFELIDAAARAGRDIAQLNTDLIQHFRDVLVAAQSNGGAKETGTALSRQAERINPEQLVSWILAFSEAQRDIRYAPNPRTLLEVTALKLCTGVALSKDESMEAVLARLAKMEAQLNNLIENGLTVRATAAPAAVPPTAQEAEPVTTAQLIVTVNEPTAPAFDPALLKKIQTDWAAFCKEFPNPMKTMLTGSAVGMDGAFITIAAENSANADFMKSRQKILSEKLAIKYGVPSTVNLAFKVRDAYNNHSRAAKPAPVSPPPVNQQSVKAKAEPSAADTPPWNDEDDWASLGQQVDMSEGDWANG